MTKIVCLRITNYKAFFEENEITLSTDPKKPFNVIYANNGSGKTTFLDAISWCLYGEQMYKPQNINKILNDEKSEQLSPGESAEVKVELWMGKDEENIDYIFERSLPFHKTDKGNIIANDHAHMFSVKLKDARNNFITSPNPSFVANSIFPEEIVHLFMFDGEDLKNFFEEDNIKKTKQAIIDISQIDFLQIAIKHLMDISKKYKEKVSDDDLSDKIDSCLNIVKMLKKQKTEFEKELNDIEKQELPEAESEFEKINELLMKKGEKELKNLIKKENELDEYLVELTNKFNNLKSESFVHLLKSIPSIFCMKALEKADDEIDKKYKKGGLPPNIKIEFLKKLLKEKKCICGTKLNLGSSERKLVEKLLTEAPLSEYEGEIREIQIDINSILKNLNNTSNQRKDYYKRIRELDSEIVKKTKDLRQTKKERENLNLKEKEITSLVSQRDFYYGEIKRLTSRQGYLRNVIETQQGRIEDEELRKRELESKGIKNLEKRQKFNYCSDAIKFFERIDKEITFEVKDEIEKRTNDIFKKGIIEPRVESIKITDDFECKAVDKQGDNIYKDLSSGQKEVLATAFMISLRKESGFDSPILFDYPFGRMDPEATRKLIDSLKNVLKDVQVNFFLINGREYTDMVWKQMKDFT
ncbi:MAG: hypothetical protein PHS81_02925, partial [Candidatus Nanoarchaeia archaeon]|nr:hypothetical protein [Candidatus Nanoarchaeia archaeon]